MRCRIDRVGTLQKQRVDEMFRLLRCYYKNVCRTSFDADLQVKHFVIVLEDDTTGELCGFSTQELYVAQYQGKAIRVVFSGDTVISPAFWGSQALPIAFGRMMLTLLDGQPDTPLYWLLISKGHRTYRYLPVFFRDFHPSGEHGTSNGATALLDYLAKEKFGTAYDPATGVLRAAVDAQCLRSDLAYIEHRRIRRDRHTAFFLHRNPNYSRGDELVCLAPFRRDNLKPYILRQLEAGELPIL